MDFGKVLVNLAPFIGAAQPCGEWIPCEILAEEGTRVQIRTRYPYRDLTLWVEQEWLDTGQHEAEEMAVAQD